MDFQCISQQNKYLNDPETVLLRVDTNSTVSIFNTNIKNFNLSNYLNKGENNNNNNNKF